MAKIDYGATPLQMDDYGMDARHYAAPINDKNDGEN
jgi:hypothetical protein